MRQDETPSKYVKYSGICFMGYEESELDADLLIGRLHMMRGQSMAIVKMMAHQNIA
jgi:hypothetical protein